MAPIARGCTRSFGGGLARSEREFVGRFSKNFGRADRTVSFTYLRRALRICVREKRTAGPSTALRSGRDDKFRVAAYFKLVSRMGRGTSTAILPLETQYAWNGQVSR
jgi:hypothetical protein